MAAVIIIGLVLFATSKKPAQPNETPTNSETPVEVTKDYNKEAQLALDDYEMFLEGDKNKTDIENRRSVLLALKITKEYQDLHLALVRIADTLINSTGDSAANNKARLMISEVLAKNSLLKK